MYPACKISLWVLQSRQFYYAFPVCLALSPPLLERALASKPSQDAKRLLGATAWLCYTTEQAADTQWALFGIPPIYDPMRSFGQTWSFQFLSSVGSNLIPSASSSKGNFLISCIKYSWCNFSVAHPCRHAGSVYGLKVHRHCKIQLISRSQGFQFCTHL